MEAIGGASAVAGLLILGTKLTIQVQTFVTRIKNASQDVRHIVNDLQSLVIVLGRLEGALNDPACRNVFNAMNGSSDFDSVTVELMSIFTRFQKLMRKYDKVDQSSMQKAKWGWSGESEALILGRTLVTHKQTLSLTLQMTTSLALSSIGGGIDHRLRQTEDNTQQILLEVRQMVQPSAPAPQEPARSVAVRSWLQQVATYASSVTASSVAGDDDRAQELRNESTANIRLHNLPPTRPAQKPYGQSTQLRLPAEDATAVASEDTEYHNRTETLSFSGRSEVTDAAEIFMSPAAPPENVHLKDTKFRKDKHSRNFKAAMEATFEQATLLKDQGRHEEEVMLYTQACARFDRPAEAEDDDYLDQMHYLGVRLKNHKRFDQAVEMLTRVLSAYETRRGPLHLQTLNVVKDLASTYQGHRQTNKAEELRKRAIEGFEETIGPDSHRALYSVLELGRLYIDGKRLEEAEPLINRALEGFRNKYGSKDSATGSAILQLGRIYRVQKRDDDFEQLHKDELKTLDTPETQDHFRTIEVMFDLGVFYMDRGRLAEAEEIMKRAVAGGEKRGYKKKTTADSISSLALIYRKEKKFIEAEELYRRTLPAFEECLGLKHRTTLRHMMKFGGFYVWRERPQEAKKLFEIAVPTFDAAFGPQDNIFRKAATDLGRIYRDEGRTAEAEVMFVRAMATERKSSSTPFLHILKPEDDARSDTSSKQERSIIKGYASSESNPESEQRPKAKRPFKKKEPLPKVTSTTLATIAAQSHSATLPQRSKQGSSHEGKRSVTFQEGAQQRQPSSSKKIEKRDGSTRSKASSGTEGSQARKHFGSQDHSAGDKSDSSQNYEDAIPDH